MMTLFLNGIASEPIRNPSHFMPVDKGFVQATYPIRGPKKCARCGNRAATKLRCSFCCCLKALCCRRNSGAVV